LCSKWTKRCNKKAKPIKTVRKDYPFKEVSDKELEMERMMAKMKEMGVGGMSMYNRDDMEDMLADGGYGDDVYSGYPGDNSEI
jgi:hypothetical protein